ncbi:hypothetical protein [Polyangium jinanense]|uniref:Lipoprotein n=1 Tax=Polyangium jinanense TaxID=2829994 RepID=A0A9X3X8H7_9BACT|nr:hypothetical protein [Polyangium jinanense]MDC3960898.1 hypothetical protein [Polyangium jinanense]MDC3984495.1 hypothetical protein [Polyangium jinanense]
MLSRVLSSLALMCLVGCGVLGASSRGAEGPIDANAAKPHAAIIPAEIDYVNGEIVATILFDDAAGAANAVGTLRGPDGFLASIPIAGANGKCDSVFFTFFKGACAWRVPDPKKGPYTLEVRAGSEVLSTATFELVQVPAYDAKRDFTVKPSSRTDFGYVRETHVVAWVPFDLRDEPRGYRAIVRRNGQVVQDENFSFRAHNLADNRASHAFALEARHVDGPGAYEVGFADTATGDVLGAWSFAITDFDGRSKGVDVWLHYGSYVFGKLTPLPADRAKALFTGMTTIAPRAVDEPTLCARLSDPTYRRTETWMGERVRYGVSAEYDQLETAVRDPSTSPSERERAQRRMAQLEPQMRKEWASRNASEREARAKLHAVRSKFAAGCFDKLLDEASAATP